MRLRGFAIALAWTCAAACTGGPGSASNACLDPPRGSLAPVFGDVTGASGIAFEYQTPDNKAGGLAVADLDGDGRPDVVASRRVGGLALFHNLGGMRFEDVTAASGLDSTLAINAITAADLDNDGDLDLVLVGTDFAYVMANQGDGTFVQAAMFAESGTTEQVLAADLDGDGQLDLYFSNYDLVSLVRTTNRLYMNRGGLQFTYAETANVGGGLTWTATAFDFDGDGDEDIYVANDTLLADFGGPSPPPGPIDGLVPDVFLRNDGVGSDGVPIFTDIAPALGLNVPRSSMGGLLADFDGDGQLDLYVPNDGAKKLFLRDAGGGFVESAVAMGLAGIERVNARCPAGNTIPDDDCVLLSWTAALSDFDLDGYDELLEVNGATELGDSPPVLMFARGDDFAFHEVAPDISCVDARGLVVTDLDGDGDQDVVISQKDGPLLVYENTTHPQAGSWLDVTLRGRTSNREGRGAVVTAHMASGRTQLKIVGTGGIINSSTPTEAFFGLGADSVDELDVQWPSGQTSVVMRPAPGAVAVDEAGG